MKQLMHTVIASPELHGRWLNTLSYFENEGAKLLADCQHPTLVPEQMLKHAAEEFRHAYYLKNQISKVWPSGFDDYRIQSLMGDNCRSVLTFIDRFFAKKISHTDKESILGLLEHHSIFGIALIA